MSMYFWKINKIYFRKWIELNVFRLIRSLEVETLTRVRVAASQIGWLLTLLLVQWLLHFQFLCLDSSFSSIKGDWPASYFHFGYTPFLGGWWNKPPPGRWRWRLPCLAACTISQVSKGLLFTWENCGPVAKGHFWTTKATAFQNKSKNQTAVDKYNGFV